MNTDRRYVCALCHKKSSSFYFSDEMKKTILKEFRANTQSYLLTEYLMSHSKVSTEKLKKECNIKTISQLVSACVNPKLKYFGYRVSCEKPIKSITDKFGRVTTQYLWSIVEA